jgi:uncharacterized protein (TIGR03437 family)
VWTVKPDPQARWIAATPATGTGPGNIKVSLANSLAANLAAGNHSGQLTISTEQGQPVTLTVNVSVAAAEPRPRYTYLKGPNGCTRSPGYEDDAVCVVPDEKPPGTFKPPKRGGAYIDPNFGALVRVISEPPTNHAYSTPNPLNANNKYALIGHAGFWAIVSPTNGKVLKDTVPAVEAAMWDAKDPEVFYNIRGSRVEKYDVKRDRTSVVVDYSSTTPRLASITNGSTGDSSKDNWISFYAPGEKQVCALDLQNVKTYCASYDNVSDKFQLAPAGFMTLTAKGIDSETGKRYIILTAHPTMAVFSVNMAAGKLDLEFLAPENITGSGNGDGVCDPNERCIKGDHADTFEDSKGIQYVTQSMETTTPCSTSIYSFRLNRGMRMLQPVEIGGGAKRLFTLQNCGGVDPWTDWHMGCAKQSPYCVVSTSYGPYRFTRKPDDSSPIKRTAHLSEVVVIKDNGAEIRRLVQHRSVAFSNEEANGYWSTARASISNDGSLVVFDSNFGEPNRQRVVIAETGFGPTKIAGVVDGASFGPKLSPGGIASILGTNLAHCNQQASELPLTASLCNTTAKIGDQPAPVMYASTSQLNVQVPTALATDTSVQVTVSRGDATEDNDTIQLEPGSVVRQAPVLFTYRLPDEEEDRPLLMNVDGKTKESTLNGPEGVQSGIRPQVPGDAGIIYANNLGPVEPAGPDGHAAPSETTARTKLPVNVVVNGVRQDLIFSGLAPGFVGLYQINYVLTPNTPILDAGRNRIWVEGEASESARLPISLKNN